jgi:hypothetical protein
VYFFLAPACPGFFRSCFLWSLCKRPAGITQTKTQFKHTLCNRKMGATQQLLPVGIKVGTHLECCSSHLLYIHAASVSHNKLGTPWCMAWDEVQIVIPYHVGHLQHYSIKVHGIITSVYPPLAAPLLKSLVMGFRRTQVFLLTLRTPATYSHDFTCTLILEMV